MRAARREKEEVVEVQTCGRPRSETFSNRLVLVIQAEGIGYSSYEIYTSYF